MYIINENEIESLLTKDASDRYSYFIKRVADWGEVWGLFDNESWAISQSDDGMELFPVWPHPVFAEICATDHWKDFAAAPIEIDEWMNQWLPGLTQDNRLVAVFPLPTGKGASIAPVKLREDLQNELSLIE